MDTRHTASFLVTLNSSGKVPFNVHPEISMWGKASALPASSTKIITLIVIIEYPDYSSNGTLVLRSLC